MKIHNSKFIILNSIIRAYKSLKVLLDPAIEGNPYKADLPNKTYGSNKTSKSYQFIRRRFGWNRF